MRRSPQHAKQSLSIAHDSCCGCKISVRTLRPAGGWPTDWEDTLVLFNTSSYVVNSTNQPPKFLLSQVCYETFLSNKTSCTLATCNESSLGAGLGANASFSIGDATTWCDAVTGVPSTNNCTTATMVYTKPCYWNGRKLSNSLSKTY
jgi:hypothetical protein